MTGCGALLLVHAVAFFLWVTLKLTDTMIKPKTVSRPRTDCVDVHPLRPCRPRPRLGIISTANKNTHLRQARPPLNPLTPVYLHKVVCTRARAVGLADTPTHNPTTLAAGAGGAPLRLRGR